MPFPLLTVEQACEALASVGIRVSTAALHVEPRDERWVVRLPPGRLAWFAVSREGRARLATERRVLRVLEARCRFRAPRVLHEGADGDFDVRAMLPGETDPFRLFDATARDPALAARIGAAIGALLANQHLHVPAADVADWLPGRPRWPALSDELRAQLPLVVDDAALLDRIDAVLSAYDAVTVADRDRVLVHADVGFHNLGVDPESLVVHGIFDYDGAAFADRHHDFRYLVFLRDDEPLLEGALAVYEPAVGLPISRDRVTLYNAACAVAFLAHRAGTRPNERPCGRTLDEDLGWTRAAVTRALVAVRT